MSEYEFDFSKLKLRDMKKIWSPDVTPVDHLEFLDKVTVGGVMDLPFSEFETVAKEALAAYEKWIAEVRTTAKADLGAWREMLRDVKGL